MRTINVPPDIPVLGGGQWQPSEVASFALSNHNLCSNSVTDPCVVRQLNTISAQWSTHPVPLTHTPPQIKVKQEQIERSYSKLLHSEEANTHMHAAVHLFL